MSRLRFYRKPPNLKGVMAKENGLTTIGTLLVILIVVLVVYLGGQVGSIFLSYYEILGHMEGMADRAELRTDKDIRNFLEDQIRKLKIPADPKKQLVINRRSNAMRITLEYEDVVELDLGERGYWVLHTFYFNPVVERPLK